MSMFHIPNRKISFGPNTNGLFYNLFSKWLHAGQIKDIV